MNSTSAQTANNTPIKYRPSGALFTKAEQKLLVALRHICGDDFHIFGKVCASDNFVLDVPVPNN
jgi:hypothetical protein